MALFLRLSHSAPGCPRPSSVLVLCLGTFPLQNPKALWPNASLTLSGYSSAKARLFRVLEPQTMQTIGAPATGAALDVPLVALPPTLLSLLSFNRSQCPACFFSFLFKILFILLFLKFFNFCFSKDSPHCWRGRTQGL